MCIYYIYIYTLQTIMTMEEQLFEDVSPIKQNDLPAMLLVFGGGGLTIVQFAKCHLDQLESSYHRWPTRVIHVIHVTVAKALFET